MRNTIPVDDRHEIVCCPGWYPAQILRDGQPLPMTSRIRHAAERLASLAEQGDLESSRAHALTKTLRHEITRGSLYAVQLHEGRRAFDGLQVCEKPAEYGRSRFFDGKVFHLDLPKPTDDQKPEEILIRACQSVSPLNLLGVKARDTGPSAVFLPRVDFTNGLVQAFGEKIAQTVLEEDRLDRLQFLTILAHREGQEAKEDVAIPFPTFVENSAAYDGLIADLDLSSWSQLLSAFALPEEATWLQVTIFDKDEGLATKGALRRCPKGRTPATYAESWKIGMPSGSVRSRSILVHESDVTYRPPASLNLQMLAYNFTEEEREQLVREIFLPGIEGLLDYKWTAKLRGIDRLLAAGADMRLEPVVGRINALRKKLAFQGVHKVEVPGFRAKVAPDPSLEPFTCRVPRGQYGEGDLVDLTRDPSLPVGNSTQRYRVVGFTEGFTVEVPADPWSTIQGGDYDGDDCCIQRVTVEMFRRKAYDQTNVSTFRSAKKTRRTGVLDEAARFASALRVLERPIGIGDILARRLLEEGRLGREERLALSTSIQNAIDSAKHATEVTDHGLFAEGDHAIDAIRRGDWEAEIIQDSWYGPLVSTARKVAAADLEPVAFDDMPIRLAWAAMSAHFLPEAVGDASRLAGLYAVKFAELIRSEPQEIDLERLADQCAAEIEKVATTLVDQPIAMDGVQITKEDLAVSCVEVALLRRTSLHFSSRVVRMKTLRLVFSSQSGFVRQALRRARMSCLSRQA